MIKKQFKLLFFSVLFILTISNCHNQNNNFNTKKIENSFNSRGIFNSDSSFLLIKGRKSPINNMETTLLVIEVSSLDTIFQSNNYYMFQGWKNDTTILLNKRLGIKQTNSNLLDGAQNENIINYILSLPSTKINRVKIQPKIK